MQYFGKIDIKKFENISKNIITDKVVLTDKQRIHIEQRHPKVLEKYEKYFINIIQEPDFILKDKSRENTALLLKNINVNHIGSINLVLRLAVKGDYKGNKNSIITCIPIGKNRLKSYINNGKIIYKRE